MLIFLRKINSRFVVRSTPFRKMLYPRFFPPRLPPDFPLNAGLPLEKLGLPLSGRLLDELLPPPGFAAPLKFGFGFQPPPVLRSPVLRSAAWPPLRGAPASRLSGLPAKGLLEPKLGRAASGRPPGLLFGRAPPARGLPLLVVKGRGNPVSPRNGRGESPRPRALSL